MDSTLLSNLLTLPADQRPAGSKVRGLIWHLDALYPYSSILQDAKSVDAAVRITSTPSSLTCRSRCEVSSVVDRPCPPPCARLTNDTCKLSYRMINV